MNIERLTSQNEACPGHRRSTTICSEPHRVCVWTIYPDPVDVTLRIRVERGETSDQADESLTNSTEDATLARTIRHNSDQENHDDE